MISHTCGNNKFGIQSPQYTFNARLMLRYCCQAQEIPQEEVLAANMKSLLEVCFWSQYFELK